MRLVQAQNVSYSRAHAQLNGPTENACRLQLHTVMLAGSQPTNENYTGGA